MKAHVTSDEQIADGLEAIGVTVWGPRAEDFAAGFRWAQEVQVQRKPAGPTKNCRSTEKLQAVRFTKDDTRALWYAIDWMQHVLFNWGRDGFKDETDRAQYDYQRELLLQAKRALRKANEIRKAQR